MQIVTRSREERVQSTWQALLQQTARTPGLAPVLLRRYHAFVTRSHCFYDQLRRQPRHIRPPHSPPPNSASHVAKSNLTVS